MNLRSKAPRSVKLKDLIKDYGEQWTTYVNKFWEDVDKRGEQECWEWRGYVQTAGYGLLRMGPASSHIRFLTHRLSWLIHHGSLPKIFVCHKCDNPKCVNPAHLFLGTHADNMADCRRKGRNTHPAPWSAKLTELQVREIKTRFKLANISRLQMSYEYGVSSQALDNIYHGVTWRHVT